MKPWSTEWLTPMTRLRSSATLIWSRVAWKTPRVLVMASELTMSLPVRCAADEAYLLHTRNPCRRKSGE